MSRKEKKKKNKTQKWWTFIKVQIVLILLVLLAIGYYYLGGYASKIGSMHTEAVDFVAHSSVDTFRSTQTSMAYDCEDNLISVLKGEKDVYYIYLEDIPDYAKNAFICVEDRKFYEHKGIDYRGIARAVVAMLRNGKVTQGGSTITQQLARNVFLSNDKTWERKIEEIYIASELEKKYSKQEILEFYLNNIYFGNGYYGIQAASRGYFNEDVSKLSLSQIAFLAAIPNSPTRYDPLKHFDDTMKRRDLVLKEMLESQSISLDSYNAAVNEEIHLVSSDKIQNNYVETYIYYCATRVLMQLNGFSFRTTFSSPEDEAAYYDKYDAEYSRYNEQLYKGGYRIYTSIDMKMQNALQGAIDNGLSSFSETGDDGVFALQASGVCIDNGTGMVKAIVGGRTQDNIGGYTLNRAFQSYRQPGSAIKPLIVYTPALERGYTPDSIVVDAPIENGPKNSDGSYAGPITIRRAVELSKNTIAFKLFNEITPESGLSYLTAMHFKKINEKDYVLAASLGGFSTGVSALEMAEGYATIENDGIFRQGTCITKICDASGNSLYENDQKGEEIYKENAARTMTDILQSVVTNGTAKGLGLANMPTAGKTGTTNDNKDGWFVGYTPYYTTSVWVGYDMPRELTGLFGSTYPGKIWKDYMSQIHEGLDYKEFLKVAEIIGQ